MSKSKKVDFEVWLIVNVECIKQHCSKVRLGIEKTGLGSSLHFLTLTDPCAYIYHTTQLPLRPVRVYLPHRSSPPLMHACLFATLDMTQKSEINFY